MMALVIEVEFQIAILPLWVFQNGIQSTGAALGGKTSSIFDEIVVPASEWKILRDKVERGTAANSASLRRLGSHE
jgi:hypothetical protein